MSSPEEKLRAVQNRISQAEKRAGRSLAESVTLIAVSKTKSMDAVLSAARAGAIHFGENYVQEATKKMERIKSAHPELNLRWHLIGSLQTNKSKYVVGRFETIQSVDRIELAKALNARAQEAGVVQNILVQIKMGDEPTKGGITPTAAPELIKQIILLSNLKLEGLMSLPPIEAEPESARKYFIQLRELYSQMKLLVPPERGSFKYLSMGTSHDFEVAVEEGANMVRVGTAIFGAREMGGGN